MAEGARILFMDADEAEEIASRPLTGKGVPRQPGSRARDWMIDGQRFTPSRQDSDGNWIFRLEQS